jgi:hypothetical protein
MIFLDYPLFGPFVRKIYRRKGFRYGLLFQLKGYNEELGLGYQSGNAIVHLEDVYPEKCGNLFQVKNLNGNPFAAHLCNQHARLCNLVQSMRFLDDLG